MTYPMHAIARARSDFGQKFGVPRQSGLVPALKARIVFEPDFADPAAVRGLEDFSHLWLIWVFDRAITDHPHPTVRPPRLGGERVGVFATRSPHRPNPIGLSSVAIEEVHDDGSVTVSGADLVDGTPILDVKPYVATDSHPDARVGFQSRHTDYRLTVTVPERLRRRIPPGKEEALIGALAEDPRPHFHRDVGREYAMAFAGVDVRFTVEDDALTVTGVSRPR